MRLACPNITGFGSTIPREYGLIIALISLRGHRRVESRQSARQHLEHRLDLDGRLTRPLPRRQR
jgi:hypothetical protein